MILGRSFDLRARRSAREGKRRRNPSERLQKSTAVGKPRRGPSSGERSDQRGHSPELVDVRASAAQVLLHSRMRTGDGGLTETTRARRRTSELHRHSRTCRARPCRPLHICTFRLAMFGAPSRFASSHRLCSVPTMRLERISMSRSLKGGLG